MTAWWNDRSPRERMLLMVLGGILGVGLLFLLILKPLGDWRSSAAQRAVQARDGYEMVASAAALGGTASSTAPQNTTPIRAALTQSAAAADIQLVRIGAEVNGQLEVQPEQVDGERLFEWLGNLEQQYGVTVAFADISRTDDGGVNAQVLIFTREK